MIEPQIVTKTIKTVVDGQVVSLGEVEVEDPSLVLSTYEVQVVGFVDPTIEYEPPTVELSYLGEGTITVTNPNPIVLSATYDSVTRTITLVSNQSEEDDNVDVNLTVSLNRLGNCVTESVTLTVHCSPVLLDPQLNVSVPSDVGKSIGATGWYKGFPVSFLGNGTITASVNKGSVSYNATDKTLYFSTGSEDKYTLMVSISASPPYYTDTKTYSFETYTI